MSGHEDKFLGCRGPFYRWSHTCEPGPLSPCPLCGPRWERWVGEGLQPLTWQPHHGRLDIIGQCYACARARVHVRMKGALQFLLRLWAPELQFPGAPAPGWWSLAKAGL